MPAPQDGTYDLTWQVPGPPVSTQMVTYVVKAGRIETTFGPLVWDEAESIFAHPTAPIGLQCSGAHTFIGTSPNLSTVGTCLKRPGP